MQWAFIGRSPLQCGLGSQQVIRRCRWGLGHPQDTSWKRSGAARLTSGDTYGPGFQDVQQFVSEEPSTSRGAGCVEQNFELEDKVLDYDEGDQQEEEEIVQQKG
ncbi:hypothetical protein NDU88_005344 [Pleurodeles waltl]|uniref:Uncharacterized protein n=1 Tax=Pleurodeles waltl TaxID=8319 RepID=A0AAV7W7K2_PLEWA|nr:hypothetical protein NDU88_005344 [Pleurodeles waltl]